MANIININDLNELNSGLEILINQIMQLKYLINYTAEDLNKIKFIGPEDFAAIYGCSIKTAQKIYTLPDFPSSDFGKQRKAEVTEIKKYFRKHIEKSHLKYWDDAA